VWPCGGNIRLCRAVGAPPASHDRGWSGGAATPAARFGRPQALIARRTESTRRLAERAVDDALAGLRSDGYEPLACGLVAAAGRPLPGLEKILASHALIHAAEGQLFRDALAAAAERAHLPVAALPERELGTRARAALALTEDELRERLAAFGRALGPPWRQDEKQATLAAWLVLLEPDGV
jgi:hypothetical protein